MTKAHRVAGKFAHRMATLLTPSLTPSLRASVSAFGALAPGLALTLVIALLATALHAMPGLDVLSAPILATGLGMAVRNLAGAWPAAARGQAFVLRRLLRLAIVLLGFQISVGQILSIGAWGVAIVLATAPATFVVTILVGRWMGVDTRLTALIAAGTSICGASAIAATNSVVEAPEEDVAYAIACITLWGTAAMFIYPGLASVMGLKGVAYGLWAGGSIHEVAQAVGAAFQGDAAAGHAGVVAKLLRVALLGPLVMTLAARRRDAGGRAPTPWFLLLFLIVIAANSILPPPPAISQGLALITTFLMTMALAAMGLATNFRGLIRQGVKPLLLSGLATLFISASVLALVLWRAWSRAV